MVNAGDVKEVLQCCGKVSEATELLLNMHCQLTLLPPLPVAAVHIKAEEVVSIVGKMVEFCVGAVGVQLTASLALQHKGVWRKGWVSGVHLELEPELEMAVQHSLLWAQAFPPSLYTPNYSHLSLLIVLGGTALNEKPACEPWSPFSSSHLFLQLGQEHSKGGTTTLGA